MRIAASETNVRNRSVPAARPCGSNDRSWHLLESLQEVGRIHFGNPREIASYTSQ
jgi:hypothetical protein